MSYRSSAIKHTAPLPAYFSSIWYLKISTAATFSPGFSAKCPGALGTPRTGADLSDLLFRCAESEAGPTRLLKITQLIPRRRQTSKTFCKVKKAGQKWPQIAWSHLHEMSIVGKSIKTEKGLGAPWGWDRGGRWWGMTANGHKVYLGFDTNVLKLDFDEGCTLSIYLKTLNYTLQMDELHSM